MIYAAKIENGIVTQVISAPSIAFCLDEYGGTWIETKMDGSIRGVYAGIGYAYNPTLDKFVAPPVLDSGPPR